MEYPLTAEYSYHFFENEFKTSNGTHKDTQLKHQYSLGSYNFSCVGMEVWKVS